jgi:hypothetical protein
MMSVQLNTIDILTQRAHFEPEVARAVAEAIAVQQSHSMERFATKADLENLRNELKFEIAREIANLRTEMYRLVIVSGLTFMTLTLGGVYGIMSLMLSRLQ